MLDINDDVWKDDIWGSQLLKTAQTELFFYYGAKDHWVADVERDLIIERRGRGAKRWIEVLEEDDDEDLGEGEGEGEEVRGGVRVLRKSAVEEEDAWKPRMMVCEEGIPHGFCICMLLSLSSIVEQC